MIMEAPQIIYTVLISLHIGIVLTKFGQRKTDHYDWGDLFFGPAISIGLMYWGGFFSGGACA